MNDKYNLREVTPEYMSCAAFGCPSIYEERRNVTPKDMSCAIIGCPAILQTSDSYLIIGAKVNPSEVGLEGKVNAEEVLIRVPKKLIDEKEK